MSVSLDWLINLTKFELQVSQLWCNVAVISLAAQISNTNLKKPVLFNQYTKNDTGTPKQKSRWGGGAFLASHTATTSSASMHSLTLEHPVQIIKRFADIWGWLPGPRAQRRAELAEWAALHPSVAETTWRRVEQKGGKEKEVDRGEVYTKVVKRDLGSKGWWGKGRKGGREKQPKSA